MSATSTRDMVMKSWDAARVRADVTGAFVGNAASVAGQYLAFAYGDATRAVAMLPAQEGVFWARVASLLISISADERELHTRTG